tara:strand:- start:18050 stop:18418 length:369 start_codon:yes stop_codon:yes gene_type:complete
MVNKKGQGLSLNVIIVAAIALVVLVVLIVIFTGRAGDFDKKVNNEAKQELTAMKTFYGTCHPSGIQESKFILDYSKALILDSEERKLQDQAKAKADFQEEIDKCIKAGSFEDTCTATDCLWG